MVTWTLLALLAAAVAQQAGVKTAGEGPVMGRAGPSDGLDTVVLRVRLPDEAQARAYEELLTKALASRGFRVVGIDDPEAARAYWFKYVCGVRDKRGSVSKVPFAVTVLEFTLADRPTTGGVPYGAFSVTSTPPLTQDKALSDAPALAERMFNLRSVSMSLYDDETSWLLVTPLEMQLSADSLASERDMERRMRKDLREVKGALDNERNRLLGVLSPPRAAMWAAIRQLGPDQRTSVSELYDKWETAGLALFALDKDVQTLREILARVDPDKRSAITAGFVELLRGVAATNLLLSHSLQALDSDPPAGPRLEPAAAKPK